ncbi:MAG: FkbM family methyltransferase [bacterium]|nr:FkbM family methyltransferase [bacterium]
MKPLKEFLCAQGWAIPRIGILDIGAMLLGNQPKEYQLLLDNEMAQVAGFEPVPSECDRLNAEFESTAIHFYPYFIGDGTRQTFRLNRASMTSSLYATNNSFVRLFQGLPELMLTVESREVETKRLDDIREIDFDIDYIKIDIQGGELQALEGARERLENVTVIQTEVEFLPLYRDQPLFSEVELYLRSRGFVLHRFLHFGTRSFAPFSRTDGKHAGPQQLWADALFVKDFSRLELLSERQLVVLATLMHDVYHSWDMVGMLVRYIGDKQGVNDVHLKYMDWLQGKSSAAPVEKAQTPTAELDCLPVAVNIRGDISVCVPNSNSYMTTYVLREQGDWFEDEIGFLRQYISPGMHALDIGANYGLYTLTMAKLIGPTGRVWAIEPSSNTASYLKASLERNGFQNVNLEVIGLSSRNGTAWLTLNDNAELNQVSARAEADGKSEEIRLSTLDDLWLAAGKPDLQFIKMDAEGEELNILEVSGKMLSETSPLIMFERKHGSAINTSLMDKFVELGFALYRLLPGPQVLVPFDRNQSADSFLLNLFAAQSDRARELERVGLLVSEVTEPSEVDASAIPQFDFQRQLAMPDSNSQYGKVFEAYARSRDTSLSTQERVSNLLGASRLSEPLLTGTEPIPFAQASTIARVHYDAGLRATGNQIVQLCLNEFQRASAAGFREAFFPVSPELEELDTRGNILRWAHASFLNAWIDQHAYSTYFTGAETRPQLQQLLHLGYLSGKAQRILDLMQGR